MVTLREDPGLFAHDDLPLNVAGLGDRGLFKTPTLRNATKNERGITKAFMHNGYFKKIEDIVHYYNTRFDGTGAPTDLDPVNNSKTVCEDIGIENATAAEAIANDCWPVPEFPGTVSPGLAGLLGNLGLTEDEEAALVAYLVSLEDEHTPTAPSSGQVIVDTARRRCSRGGQVGLPFFFAHPAQPRTDCRPREVDGVCATNEVLSVCGLAPALSVRSRPRAAPRGASPRRCPWPLSRSRGGSRPQRRRLPQQRNT